MNGPASVAASAAKKFEHAGRILARERTLCLLPWAQPYVGPDGTVRPCCVWAGTPVGSARSAPLKELWNSPSMKALRRDMLDGNSPAGCSVCRETERSGLKSLRLRRNESLRRHRDRVSLTRADGSLDAPPIPIVEVRFSNACNLRCRMCSPAFSSAWAADARALGMPASTPLLKAYDDWAAFESQFLEFLESGVEEILFMGGEPLIMDEHYRILALLLERRLFRVPLRYVTNFSTLRHKTADVLDLWPRFSDVGVTASLDAFGSKGEYLRKGLRWNGVLGNRREMARRCPDVSFGVLATLSLFNALHLPDLHRELAHQGLIEADHFQINPLLEPLEYRAQALPADLKALAAKKLDLYAAELARFAPNAAKDFHGAARFLEARDLSGTLVKFAELTRRLDRIRGEDFRTTFPELASLIEPAGTKKI